MTLQNVWIPLFWSSLSVGSIAGFLTLDDLELPKQPDQVIQQAQAVSVPAPPAIDVYPLVMQHVTEPETTELVQKFSTVSENRSAVQLDRIRPDKPELPTRTVLPGVTVNASDDDALNAFGDLGAVAMMQAAANQTKGPETSQLDVILASIQSAPPALPPKTIPAAAPKPEVFEENPDLLRAVRPLPATMRMSMPKPRARPAGLGQRPVARSNMQKAKRARPSFTAQHFHDLRHHAHQKPSGIACVAELQLIAARAHIYFEAGSSEVNNPGMSAARLIAAKAQSCPEARVSIIGFTDPGGSKEINLKLSWLRANAVFHSIEDAGFSTARIAVSSHMEDHPEECLHYEGVDRRVVFTVLEK